MIKKIVAILFISLIFSCGHNPEPKEILFVCTHGAARSPIAAAYFNKIVKDKDLNYRAIYRGTEPDSVLTNETVEGLSKDEFIVNDWKPVKVSENDINRAHKIITFDCKLPSKIALTNLEQWNGTPPISQDYDKARNIIKEKVNLLIDNLSKK